MATMRHHEFIAVNASPYCAACGLPRANRRHQARPRTWSVRVDTYDLQGMETASYGPFPSETEALKFAVSRRNHHTTAEVSELEDPALITR